MIESFDGGQTLRQDNGEDEHPEDGGAYRPDQPVSINSSIEIVSKKKSSREAMNDVSARERSPPMLSEKTKK